MLTSQCSFLPLVFLREFKFGCGVSWLFHESRALSKLLGGIAPFLPCAVGQNTFPASDVWEQFSRGLTSRPLESCHLQCEGGRWVIGYLADAAAELLGGTLKLRYYTRPFEERFFPLVFSLSSPYGFWFTFGDSGVLGSCSAWWRGGHCSEKEFGLTGKTRAEQGLARPKRWKSWTPLGLICV